MFHRWCNEKTRGSDVKLTITERRIARTRRAIRYGSGVNTSILVSRYKTFYTSIERKISTSVERFVVFVRRTSISKFVPCSRNVNIDRGRTCSPRELFTAPVLFTPRTQGNPIDPKISLQNSYVSVVPGNSIFLSLKRFSNQQLGCFATIGSDVPWKV